MNATLIRRGLLAAIGLWALVCLVLAFWWSHEPEPIDPVARAEARAEGMGREQVTGFTTTVALIELAETLLEKRGGFLSNDVFPPGVLLDNVPNWEFGVLVQIRDMARVMRNDLSRSQSQSAEDPDLGNAEGKFFFDNSSWLFPQSEDEYRAGIRLTESYLRRLSDPQRPEAQFYARADNLRAWLEAVGTRMGSLSQRLAAAAGQRQVALGRAGDPAASKSTGTAAEEDIRTPWMQIDDVFYQARGQTWALLHLLRAAQRDFESVLRNKNAMVSLRQIIRDLEPTQKQLWSPVILNGGGFGVLANHSLVMASHVARANAAIIDLRNLLSEG